MNRNVLIAIIAIVIIIIGIVALAGNGTPDTVDVNNIDGTENTDTNGGGDTLLDTSVYYGVTTTSATDTDAQDDVKEFTITGSNFSFSDEEIRVNEGDTVRVTFVNSEGTHDWKLDEFGAATKVLNGGGQDTVEFVANKKGSFEYYCSVGTHRQMGMKGTLIVE